MTTTTRISIGDEAPNFDLTSTEDALLMLKDEVPRTAVVLYFFADPADDGSRRDLLALERGRDDWRELAASVFAVSPAKLDELKALQRELGLQFPLLRDDRGFARAYGVAAAEGQTPQPALFVVDRLQKIVWMASPVESVESVLAEVSRAVRRLPASTQTYPRRATNWLVDRWVNQKTGLRKRRA